MSSSRAATVFETDLPGVTLRGRGKVRDVYDLGTSLLIVATDRLSAFDHVLPDPIPDKGKVLNQVSLFWFGRTANVIPNHVITADPAAFPASLRPHAAMLAGQVDAGAQARHGAGRVRRPRLSGRLRLEGVPAARHGVRDRAAARA